MSARAAAFLDRDGTIIRDAAYVRDPADVELLDGAGAAIRRLNDAGIPAIVVTNQSGIARGLLTTEDYERVRARIEVLLDREGARLDATYACPHHPDISGPCDCRKPGLKLYRAAIDEHAIDASRSLFVGDRWRDVAPALAFGGHPVMLDVASTPPEDLERARELALPVMTSLAAAVDWFLDALPAQHPAQ